MRMSQQIPKVRSFFMNFERKNTLVLHRCKRDKYQL